MTISDFVCWVLRVPVSSKGYNIICKAIRYILANKAELKLYEYLENEFDKNRSCIEKNIRDAKAKSLELMSQENYTKIFRSLDKNSIKTIEFVLYAARYYEEEFSDEDKEGRY